MEFARADRRRRIRRILIAGGLESAALARAAGLLPRAAGRGVVFTLHRVDPAARAGFDPNGHLFVSPGFLAAAVEASLESGLVPVRLGDLPSLLAKPDDGRRFVCFTLDDGYRDNAEHALPVFRRYGVPFTVFVTSGFSLATRTIWWETATELLRSARTLRFDFGAGEEALELGSVAAKCTAFDRVAAFVRGRCEDTAVAMLDAAAQRHGVDPTALVRRLVMDEAALARLAAEPLADLGAHTQTHVRLTRVDDARLSREIAASRDFLAAVTGRPPTTFAFPYGNADAVGPREICAVRRAGFAVSVSTRPGILPAAAGADPGHFDRISLNGLYQRKRYVEAQLTGVPSRVARRFGRGG